MVESKVNSVLIDEFKTKSTSIFSSKFKNFSQFQSRFISDNAANRFLVANNNQIDNALDQWTKATEWHLQYRPDLIDINDEAVKTGLDVKHLHVFNYDKQNNALIYALQKNTQKGRFKPDQEFRYLVYLIEEGLRQAEKRGASKFTAVIDRRGLKFSQIDKNSIKSWQKLCQTLSLAYPERLSTAFVIGADWLFNLLYSIMKPFMNKETIKKIKLLNKPEDLQRYVDKGQLLDLYGGLYKYPYDNKLVSMGLIPEKDQAEILKEMSADLGYEIDLSNLEELQRQSNIDVNEID